jgi:hypothetical protein
MSYFEIDFLIFSCRFSGLNQKEKVENMLKRTIKRMPKNESGYVRNNFGKI